MRVLEAVHSAGRVLPAAALVVAFLFFTPESSRAQDPGFVYDAGKAFVKAGIGIANASLGVPNLYFAAETRNGPAFAAGIGYDWSRGRRFSFTPSLNYWYGHTGDAFLDGRVTFSGSRHNVIDVTLSFKFD